MYGSIHGNRPAIPCRLSSKSKDNLETYTSIIDYITETVACLSCKDDGYLDDSYICVEDSIPLVNALASLAYNKQYKILSLCLNYTRSKCHIFNKDINLCDHAWIKAELEEGHISCVDNWICKGYHDDPHICSSIAETGRLEVLKFLHERNIPWDKWTCNSSACSGHLNCLRFAHENGCEWDNELTCYYAARNGHLDCLKYAIENGCPYNDKTINAAIGGGHYNCFEYIIDRGYNLVPFKFSFRGYSNEKVNHEGFIKCLNYLISRGMFTIDLIYNCARLRSKKGYEIIKEDTELFIENTFVTQCVFDLFRMIVENKSSFEIIMEALKFVDMLITKQIPSKELSRCDGMFVGRDFICGPRGRKLNHWTEDCDIDTDFYIYLSLLPYVDKLIVAALGDFGSFKPKLTDVYISHCNKVVTVDTPITYITTIKLKHTHPTSGNEYLTSWILSAPK